MLIDRKPTAIKTFSVRTDLEAYEKIHALSENLNSTPSVLLRLAISDLIKKQKQMKATTLKELLEGTNG